MVIGPGPESVAVRSAACASLTSVVWSLEVCSAWATVVVGAGVGWTGIGAGVGVPVCPPVWARAGVAAISAAAERAVMETVLVNRMIFSCWFENGHRFGGEALSKTGSRGVCRQPIAMLSVIMRDPG